MRREEGDAVGAAASSYIHDVGASVLHRDHGGAPAQARQRFYVWGCDSRNSSGRVNTLWILTLSNSESSLHTTHRPSATLL